MTMDGVANFGKISVTNRCQLQATRCTYPSIWRIKPRYNASNYIRMDELVTGQGNNISTLKCLLKIKGKIYKTLLGLSTSMNLNIGLMKTNCMHTEMRMLTKMDRIQTDYIRQV